MASEIVEDESGFIAALLQRLVARRLRLLTAEMNHDGCADGDDVQLFVQQLVH